VRIDSPGIYTGISMSDYLSDPCPVPSLSRGTIKSLLYECPAKAYHKHPVLGCGGEEEPNSAMDLGSLVHSLLLEGCDLACCIDPENYPSKEGAVPKGWTNPSIRKARDDARSAGKIPMLREDYENAMLVVESAARQLAESELEIHSLRASGRSETVCVWQEGDTWFRTRNDWLRFGEELIIDLKTTSLSAYPGTYVKQILASSGDIQAALYTRGIQKITGKEPNFVIMAVEINPPFLCSFISLSPAFLDMANQKVNEGIAKWRQCMDSGYWPGYPGQIAYLDAPAYAISQWEELKFTAQLLEQEGKPDDLPF
jgi:hypothetical protein